MCQCTQSTYLNARIIFLCESKSLPVSGQGGFLFNEQNVAAYCCLAYSKISSLLSLERERERELEKV